MTAYASGELVNIAAIDVRTGKPVKICTLNTGIRTVKNGIRMIKAEARRYKYNHLLVDYFATTDDLPLFKL